jgi:septal ring factor EnvC (AmiA/AmiB activator)
MTYRALSCVALIFALYTVSGTDAGGGAVAAAQDSDRARADAQARRVNDRIRALQAEADRLAGEARTLLVELQQLEIEQKLQTERVAQANEAVARGEAALADATARLAAVEQRRVAQLPDLKAQLVDIYKRGRSGYARLLFGGSSMRDFSRSTRAVAALMRINEQRIAEHRLTVDEVKTERAALEGTLRELEADAGEVRRARAAAARAVASRSALIAQIDQRRDLTAQFSGELQLAYERLQQQIADVAAGRAVEPVSVPIAPFRGMLEWPAAGRISVRFAQASGRFGDTTVRNGIEIAAPDGTSVRAVHPGTVSYAEPFTGFGNLVILDHGANTFSLYGYLASIAVTRGASVDAGAEIGRVGSAPAGPPALYFEVRVDGRSVDPVQWLRPR